MANEKHLKLLCDVEAWNRWRSEGSPYKPDLRGADLRGAHLSGVNLTSADLRGAELRGVFLHEADLTRADLRGADLYEADLYKAILRGADLRGANLREANLWETDLREANLKGVENFHIKQLHAVKTICQAKLDPWLLDAINKDYPRLLEMPKELAPSDKR